MSRDEVIAAHKARYAEQARQVHANLAAAGITFKHDQEAWPLTIANAVRLLQTPSMQDSGYNLLERMRCTLRLNYYVESPTVIYIGRLPLDAKNYTKGVRIEALR